MTSASAPASMLVPTVAIPDEGSNFTSLVSQLERELILRCLEKTGGNKRQAARLLNLSRTTFIDKLHRLNLERGQRKPAWEFWELGVVGESLGVGSWSRVVSPRQAQCEAGACIRALERQRSAVLLGDLPCDRQAQS